MMIKGKVKVEDILPDDVVTMTKQLVRAFISLGCDPHCHSCLKAIKPGMEFKLAYCPPLEPLDHWGTTVDGTDEMLCLKCTPKTLIRNNNRRAAEKLRLSLGGGYTRQHKG